ncbi:MAG: hypothetical protein HYX68_03660 [Planctomycetes bacterium]|jgi:hypothetical protein|nr:hypothetical protein [Planctomycetota bacterium]
MIKQGGNLDRFLVVAMAAALCWWWPREPDLTHYYARINGKMTLDHVRHLIGFDEDHPDGRKTDSGAFERAWSFLDGACITGVFDPNGFCYYKEIAPQFCGATPLMADYIDR